MDALTLARLLRQIPKDNLKHYDTNAYIAKYGQPNQANGEHLTDEFKLPEHETFSTGSKYSTPDILGGTWQSGGTDRWVFTPSALNLQNNSPEQLANYFKEIERKNSFIKLPNGDYIEGSQ